MMRCLVAYLPALPVCLAVVQLLSPCSAQFAVVGPREPILAMVGGDAELPCQLCQKMSAETMELMWVRSSSTQVVHTYPPGQEDTLAAEYQGRTSILRENITVGKAALQIRHLRASDGGTYLCYFQDGDFYAGAQVELKVAALGSDPHIEMKGYEAGGIRLMCSSGGWYPEPQIQWRDTRGHSLPAEVATEAADPQGLYAASVSVILGVSYGEEVSCVIRNPLLSQEKSGMVSITGTFFWSMELWAVVLAMLLPALLLLLVGAWCFLQQQKKIRVLTKEMERERTEKEAAEAEMQQERSTKESLQEELRWRKVQYLERKDGTQVYAEWKTALFQPADVILDTDTAHRAFLISEDKRSLQWVEEWEDLPENPRRFSGNHCVLGCESFMSGRHFWEVNVGDRKQWCVGVCRENVERKFPVRMIPENGFWGMRRSDGGDYHGLTDPWTKLTIVNPPERVGVFLDYERGDVSFYNAIDGSHIFTFPHTSFSEPLRPVFETWTLGPTPLIICPPQKPVGRSLVPDPGSDPSLNNPVDPGSADGNGDSQAEEMSLLLAAQPGAEGLLNLETSQQEITYYKHTE